MSVVSASGGGGGGGGKTCTKKPAPNIKVIYKLRSRSASSLKFLPLGKSVPQESLHFICVSICAFGDAFLFD